jgi:hypothetical protein
VSEKKPKFLTYTNPVVWGLGLTVSLGVLVLFLGAQHSPDGRTRYLEFLSSPPNAIGDTLAGIFAPLAFIWIVVTVFLQSHELSEQRKELSLTRDELKLAREAQEHQLKVMQKQADIFESEKRQRDQYEAREVVEALLKKTFDYIIEIRDEVAWDILERHPDGTSSLGYKKLFDEHDEDSLSDDALRSQLMYFTEQVDCLRGHLRKNEVSSKSHGRSQLEGFFHNLKRVVTESNDLSRSQALRIARFELPRVLSATESLLVVSNYWDDNP